MPTAPKLRALLVGINAYTKLPETRLAERVFQWGVFPDENDLVVDTPLMIAPAPIPVQDDLMFGENDHVSHVAYFEQAQTAAFLRQSLL
jgi:hypothetical protein